MGLLDWLFGRARGKGAGSRAAYSHILWSCVLDDQSCAVCADLDGTAFLSTHPQATVRPPHIDCSSPDGCRCIYVYCGDGTRDGLTVAIERAGGVLSAAAVEAWEDQRRRAANAEATRREALARAADPKSSSDYETEKRVGKAYERAKASESEDRAAAIRIYRSALDGLGDLSPDALAWTPLFPAIVNRLSLMLEREKEFQAALDVIGRSQQTLATMRIGAKAKQDAITKRRERLQKRLSK